MKPKSKRYESSTWLDRLTPIILIVLAILLVGTMVVIGLTFAGIL